jgi:hypothetical protein
MIKPLGRVLRVNAAVHVDKLGGRQFAPRRCWAFCRIADLFT